MTMPDDEIILEALMEYEENHWASEGRKWQKQINNLIDVYKERVIKWQRKSFKK